MVTPKGKEPTMNAQDRLKAKATEDAADAAAYAAAGGNAEAVANAWDSFSHEWEPASEAVNRSDACYACFVEDAADAAAYAAAGGSEADVATAAAYHAIVALYAAAAVGGE
jgi:hypothetical protein